MKLIEVNEIAIKWAGDEGWNPGLSDADSFYAADSEGFLVGLLDDEPISCISAVKYGNNFGFIGFYIVHPNFRGLGYGIQIWNEGMKRLSGRNVALDGVLAQQDNYRKSGFNFAYSNIRYEGIVPKDLLPLPNISHTFELDDVIQYDRKFFPEDRTQFLHSWLKQYGSFTLVSYDSNSAIQGYAVIRPCKIGWKIGPLFAENPEIARAILNNLLALIPENQTFYLDVPEPNHDAIRLAESFNMSVVFGTARMYTREEPEIDIYKIFGVTTFELG